MQMHSFPGRHAKLLEVNGPARVVDVFRDTSMAQHALGLGICGLVVRNAATDEQAANWHQTFENSLHDIALRDGQRRVELKGKALWYRTIQCTSVQLAR